MTFKEEFVEFRDFNISFDKHPVTRDLMLTRGTASITQSLTIILSTLLGERIMEKEVGSQLTRFLFNPPNTASSYEIKEEIERVIKRNEPRIQTLNVVVDLSPDLKSYDVTLSYSPDRIIADRELSLEEMETFRFSLRT